MTTVECEEKFQASLENIVACDEFDPRIMRLGKLA